MKTGWVMEFENEIRYAAPLRIHFQNINRSFESARVMMRVFEARIKSSTKLTQAYQRAMKDFNRRAKRT